MHKLNNNNRIDGFKEVVENALGMRAKKLKEMAATAGVGALYGLLFAGLLFAPLPPRLASQSNSPTNNSPTNSIPQPQGPRIFMPNSWDAMDCDDCDTVYNEKIKDLTDIRDDAIKAALEKYSTAVQNATQTYKTAIELENAKFNGDMARADAEFLEEL